MNLFETFQAHVIAALTDMAADGTLPSGLDLGAVVVEPPRDASNGDLATNAAMALAKAARMNPRALAEALAPRLRTVAGVSRVDIAGPGFINLTLDPQVYDAVLRAALTLGDAFGAPDRAAAGGQTLTRARVNVEYVSANPTGPMHVGHGRGAVFGDALARLLAYVGRDVTKEYYINDAGAQVDVLARSAFHRYREALGEEPGPVGEGLYPGDYLVPVGRALADAHGPALRELPESDWLPVVRDAAIDAMMAMIREDLAAVDVTHDVFFSERSLSQGHDAIAATIADLRARDLIYQGRLAPPKGQIDDDWEDREQTLFRATAFGDDVDRPLLKSDGGYTYFAADIAYHRSKIDRGFDDLIDVWGADHGGYVKRMQAAVKAVAGDRPARLEVKLCQLVKLMRGGEPVKMSKRSGDFVTLREVIDEVGRDAVRFMMLMRKNDAPLDFDLIKVREQSKDNPVFYVQYAHARCCSVIDRQTAEVFPDMDVTPLALAQAPVERLVDEAEVKLKRLIAAFPRIVDQAAQSHEPHRIAFYLFELSGELHALWNKGKDSPQLRFVNQTDQMSTSARLALACAVRGVIAAGLGILGVSAPAEMR